MPDAQKTIYRAILKQKGEFNQALIIAETQLSQQLVSYHLTRLVNSGTIKKEPKHRGCYRLVEHDDLVALILDGKMETVYRKPEVSWIRELEWEDKLDLVRYARALRLNNHEILTENARELLDEMIDTLKQYKKWVINTEPNRQDAINKLLTDEEQGFSWREQKDVLKNTYSFQTWGTLIDGYMSSYKEKEKEEPKKEKYVPTQLYNNTPSEAWKDMS